MFSLYQSARRHILQYCKFNNQCCENLKSYREYLDHPYKSDCAGAIHAQLELLGVAGWECE